METPKSTDVLISLAALTILIFGMQAAKVLLVPFLLAVLLALISVRPMIWMQAHRVPAVLAALLIVIVLMLILTALGAIVGTSVSGFTEALPTYQARLQQQFAELIALIDRHLDVDLSDAGMFDLLDPGWAMGLGVGIVNALRDVLTNAFLILFTMVFILLEASSFPLKWRAARDKGPEAFVKFEMFLSNLGRYLGIKTIVSLATGFCAWLLTWSVGVDFPLLWGLLAFLLNYVPAIGSIIAAIPAVMLALVQLGPAEAVLVILGYLAINIMFGNLIEPRLLGRGVGISPLIVFLSLVFWGWVFGPVGMLLSVPLTMTLKIALEADARTRWIAVMIGSERDAHRVLEDRETAREQAALESEQ